MWRAVTTHLSVRLSVHLQPPPVLPSWACFLYLSASGQFSGYTVIASDSVVRSGACYSVSSSCCLSSSLCPRPALCQGNACFFSCCQRVNWHYCLHSYFSLCVLVSISPCNLFLYCLVKLVFFGEKKTWLDLSNPAYYRAAAVSLHFTQFRPVCLFSSFSSVFLFLSFPL